jgi:hypothetical protein
MAHSELDRNYAPATVVCSYQPIAAMPMLRSSNSKTSPLANFVMQ